MTQPQLLLPLQNQASRSKLPAQGHIPNKRVEPTSVWLRTWPLKHHHTLLYQEYE